MEPRHVQQVVSEPAAVPRTESSKDSSEDEYLYVLGNLAHTNAPMATVNINDTPLRMLIDTGTSAGIMDETSFNQIQNHDTIDLQPPQKRIYANGSESQLNVLGQFAADISTGTKQVESMICVLRGNYGSLLGCNTAQSLDLIDIKVNQVGSQQQINNELITQFPTLFNGISKLKNTQVQLHIDDSVTPVAQQVRRIPFHLRRQVSEEITKLEEQGIIEKVKGATPWVSPVVAIPKNNEGICLCVDMRMPNTAIQREQHPSPTIDDLVHNLNGATVFSKLDLKAGCHQIPLAE